MSIKKKRNGLGIYTHIPLRGTVSRKGAKGQRRKEISFYCWRPHISMSLSALASWRLREIFLQHYNPTTVNVVLLFFALPASVVLSATGCVDPYPL